ncbi:MAG: hypothetical protein LUD50_04905, partial [Clostridia bacterium]|nr:hypothetical protein [Clostridia bacterium]
PRPCGQAATNHMEDEDYNNLEDPEPEDGSEAVKARRRKITKGVIALIVVGCFIFLILAFLFVGWITFMHVDNTACVWHPDYDEVDIGAIMDKYLKDGEELTDEDYETLYEQTGVAKIGVDRALAHGSSGKDKMLAIQKDYFTAFEVEHDKFDIPLVCTDFLANNNYMTNIYLEAGDILVSSSTHIMGWKMGHCGIVTASGKAMQAMAYGTPTYAGSITYFTSRINFMVLRPKADDSVCAAAATLAESLAGTEYNALVGIFSKKNSMEHGTQCAHLVWYSYMQQGINLDPNGGCLVLPKDIASSPELELVQVFGFNPTTLKW